MKYETAKNPIVLILGDPAYQKKVARSGSEMDADELIKRTLDRHDLDVDADAPLPKWAFRLLSDTMLSYKIRARIVMLHHFNLTGETPVWGGMKSVAFKDAPMNKNEWLDNFRKLQAEKADALIKKMKGKKK